MKFAEHLGAHITPEWHKQYIQYEPLKEMLYAAQEEAPNPEAVDDDHVQRFLASFEERFFLTCDRELAKINTFYSEKLAEAQRRFANLKNELGAIEERDRQQQTVRHRKLPSVVRKDKEKQVTVRNVHNMKLAFSEFYLSLILLQNYQQLNFTGFRKILKKHDKLMQTCKGAEWRSAHVESAPFYTNKDIDRLIVDTENVFTTKLEGGNRQKAMKRLRVPPLEAQETPWTTFRVGLFSGIFIVLFISFILSAIFVDVPTDWRPVLRMYRGIFLLVLFLFLLGVNTYGWRSSGVNHVLIFELDPRDNLNHQQLLELSGFFAVIFCLSILGSLYGDLLHISSVLHPLILVGFFIVFVVNPFKICYYTSRMWLLRLIWRISTAPFHHVGFADFWLADQLNSLVMVFYDFEYLVCFYAFRMDWSLLSLKGDSTQNNDVCMSNIYGIRPVLGCLPAWWRFSQCLRRYRDTRLAFPHLVNAGKYATTFFVVIFHSLHVWQKSKTDNEICFYLWIAASIVSSCYTLAWDLKMDWGLFDKNAGENRFLREEIVYAYKAYYYFAVIEDTILRFAWTLTVTLAEQKIIDPDILTSILASLEVIRRYIWNYFRLENEHLNNCGQFRAVRDISIAPIATNDLALLQQMMDDLEGVTHRRKNRLKNKPSKLRKSETRLRLLGSSEA